jgi:hypothetical protein
MLGTRLIFVDGLPGSGKSTTAEYVAGELVHRRRIRRGEPGPLERLCRRGQQLNARQRSRQLAVPEQRSCGVPDGRRSCHAGDLSIVRGGNDGRAE